MIRLNQLTLTQFKNYSQASFSFPNRITGICGLNGVGKTNLLDAIYYCCFTRSFFSNTDAQNIQFHADGFRLAAVFNYSGESETLVCIHRGSGKTKTVLLNEVEYPRFSQHIGHYPAVMIAPDDIEIITGGSEERRKYLDTHFSQFDRDYLETLIQYGRVLQQRNALLKQLAEQPGSQMMLLDVYDEQLIPLGQRIYELRRQYCEILIPEVVRFYHTLADNQEIVEVQYTSPLHQQSFGDILQKNRSRDMLLQRTSSGVHKDDLVCTLQGQPFRQTASQGQRKSLLFALKLAEFHLLHEKKGFPPLLLLDDVFEKLDQERMHNLLHWVAQFQTGQVFITDTHEARLREALAACTTDFDVITLG